MAFAKTARITVYSLDRIRSKLYSRDSRKMAVPFLVNNSAGFFVAYKIKQQL